jgi:hypothetical protein
MSAFVNFLPLIIKPEIVIMLFKHKEEKFVEKSRGHTGGRSAGYSYLIGDTKDCKNIEVSVGPNRMRNWSWLEKISYKDTFIVFINDNCRAYLKRYPSQKLYQDPDYIFLFQMIIFNLLLYLTYKIILKWQKRHLVQ